MATHSRCLLFSVLTLGLFLGGCATHADDLCSGDDTETLGFREATEGRHECASAFSGSEAAAYQRGWAQGIQRFCTEENGFQQGTQGAMFNDDCPPALATMYIDGYQSGYSVYLTQLEIDSIEHAIETKSGDLEQIWSALDAVSRKLDQSDVDANLRPQWLEESRTLTRRQVEVSAEIDELEFEVSARKTQLAALRHALTMSD